MRSRTWIAVGAALGVALVVSLVYWTGGTAGSTPPASPGESPHAPELGADALTLEGPALETRTGDGEHASGRTPRGLGVVDHAPGGTPTKPAFATLTLTLRVADTREPLVDAFVTLLAIGPGENEREVARDRSDSSGQVRLWAECLSDLRLTVTPNDSLAVTALPMTTPVSMADCRDREIELLVPPYEAYEFHGRVLSAEDLRPIAGLSIRGPSTLVQPIAATSDARGYFTIRVRHPSQATRLAVGAPAYGEVDVLLARGHVDEAHAAVTLLRPAGVVRGIVLDPDGGPHRGCLVTIEPTPSAAAQDVSPLASGAVCVTEDDGRFTASSLVPGVAFDVSVSVANEGASRPLATVVLAPGEVRDLELRLPALHVVRGHVYDDAGRPVADAPIEVHETRHDPLVLWTDDAPALARGASSADGSYVLENVPSGRWWIDASMPNVLDGGGEAQRDLRVRTVLEVPEASGEIVMDLRLVAPEGIDGWVRDEDGLGLEGTLVFLRCASGGGLRGVLSEAGGRFEFEQLTQGAYVIYAMIGDGSDTPERRVTSGSRGVELIAPTGGTVTGVVVGADGAPVTSSSALDGPLVRFRRAGYDDSPQDVDRDGAFVARHIRVGDWSVRAEADGRASAWQPVHVGRNETTSVGALVLERTGRLHFVAQASTRPTTRTIEIEVRRGAAIVGALSLPEGRDGVLDVPAGELRVLARTDGAPHDLGAWTIEPGTGVVVRMPPTSAPR